MQIRQILNPTRTLSGAPGTSKKRVLENIAQFICEDKPQLDADELFDALLNRERLGSTGLGHGIAIPHCRFNHCEEIVGCLITLRQPIDFDAIDGELVDVLFALIVPEQSNDEHLKTLAKLAELFSQEDFCATLRQAKDSDTLYKAAVASD